jgi:hypothetical protein
MLRFSAMMNVRMSLVELTTKPSNNLSGHLAADKYDLTMLLAP